VDRFAVLVWLSGVGVALGGLVPILGAKRGEPGASVHGFAAGTLLGVAVFFLLPESAASLGSHVGYPLLAGFLVLYLLDRILLGAEATHEAGHEEAGHAHHLAALTAAGFTLHKVADGGALGVTRANPELGLVVWASIFLHEVPATYVFSRLLVASGVRRRTIAAGVLGLTALLVGSAFATAALTDRLPARALPWALGSAAGMFLFLSTAELLPRVHAASGGRLVAVLAFLAGLGCAVAAHQLGEAHG
jgi:zinc and cadmium transporter